jgi:hypothetical protein
MEDFVTWVNTSAIKRNVVEYKTDENKEHHNMYMERERVIFVYF